MLRFLMKLLDLIKEGFSNPNPVGTPLQLCLIYTYFASGTIDSAAVENHQQTHLGIAHPSQNLPVVFGDFLLKHIKLQVSIVKTFISTKEINFSLKREQFFWNLVAQFF